MNLVFLLLSTLIPLALGNPLQGTLGQTRIVGGVEATPYEFPYIVEMRRGTHYCGGSIISPHWVLTAAHCVYNIPNQWTVIAGDHNVDSIEGPEQTRNVINISYAGDLSVPPFQNDIALIRVHPPFVFNQYVQPARLPELDEVLPGVATTAGWGRISGEGSVSSVLMKLDVPLVNQSVCSAAYSGRIPPNVICYGGEVGKGYCFGDSGGPLVDHENNTLFGVASAINGPQFCANPDYPQWYTEVSQYLPWINDVGIPIAEDSSPISTVNTCGGHIDASSGRISISNILAGQKCLWTIKTTVDFIRFTLTDAVWFNVDNLYVTQLSGAGVPNVQTRISQIGANETVYLPQGGVVLITLSISTNFPNALRSIDLDIFSGGYRTPDLVTGLASLNSNTGTLSYPVGGGNYGNNELAIFSLSAPDGRDKAVTFTRLDVEGNANCNLDPVIVYRFEEGEYMEIARLCGDTLPPAPLQLPGGIGLVTFTSNAANTGTGFTFQWA